MELLDGAERFISIALDKAWLQCRLLIESSHIIFVLRRLFASLRVALLASILRLGRAFASSLLGNA